MSVDQPMAVDELSVTDMVEPVSGDQPVVFDVQGLAVSYGDAQAVLLALRQPLSTGARSA